MEVIDVKSDTKFYRSKYRCHYCNTVFTAIGDYEEIHHQTPTCPDCKRKIGVLPISLIRKVKNK